MAVSLPLCASRLFCSSRRRHTRLVRDWSSDVCSSDLVVMRGIALFIAGTLVGLAASAVAQNQSPNRGIVGINHIALAVPDVEKAVDYYTKTMGFPERSEERRVGKECRTRWCAEALRER